jgi:hypothetical protein
MIYTVKLKDSRIETVNKLFGTGVGLLHSKTENTIEIESSLEFLEFLLLLEGNDNIVGVVPPIFHSLEVCAGKYIRSMYSHAETTRILQDTINEVMVKFDLESTTMNIQDDITS